MKFKIAFLITGVALFLSSCERDDICAETTPVTPLLVIDFFDIENTTEPKAPTNLLVVENGETIGLGFNETTISIPLRTNVDQTDFLFILNTGSENIDNPENIDELSFSYIRQEEYISKACGFRVTYDALDPNRAPGADGFWIQDIIIINSTIEDETSAHISIFH